MVLIGRFFSICERFVQFFFLGFFSSMSMQRETFATICKRELVKNGSVFFFFAWIQCALKIWRQCHYVWSGELAQLVAPNTGNYISRPGRCFDSVGAGAFNPGSHRFFIARSSEKREEEGRKEEREREGEKRRGGGKEEEEGTERKKARKKKNDNKCNKKKKERKGVGGK